MSRIFPVPGQVQPWYERWFAPGIIVFCGGVLLLLIEGVGSVMGFTVPVIASVSLLLALLSTSLAWTLTKQIRDESRSARHSVQSDLARIGSELEEPYFQLLREEFIGDARRSLHQLVDKGRGLATVEQCTNQLEKTLNALGEHEPQEILAICGQKAWSLPAVRAYYRANYAKAERGTQVKRIFIQEPGRPFSAAEKAILADHMSDDRPNVEARVIFGEDTWELKRHRFPVGFGFAILGDCVVVHWGFEDRGKTEAGRRFTDPWFIEFHRRLFWQLWDNLAKGSTEAEKDRIRRELLDG